jgi:hypothetical protein
MTEPLSPPEAKPMETERDRLRAASLGRKVKRPEKVVEVDGVKYLVISPSIAEASQIRSAGGLSRQKVGADSKAELDVDMARYLVRSIILCTYGPESRQRIFGLADEAEMLTWPPSDPLIKDLGGIAVRMVQDAEEAAKN